MGDKHDPDESDVPEWIVSAATALGMNEIRVRWKLIRWQRALRSMRRDLAPASRRFQHQICAGCGAVQDHEAKVCSSCNDKLSAPAARWLKKLGLRIPTALSISSLLAVSFIMLFGRMWISGPGQTLWGWTTPTFITYGGMIPELVIEEGQWWRLATACFMHLGIFHLGFNTVAIMQIGPSVEELFGRGRMLFFFMLTGVLAFAASALLQDAPTAGASGAIMGLIGVAAGWGQRDGTSLGREVRNQMVQWGVYTMFFGIMVNANHVAHAAGFVFGGLLGYAFDPRQLERSGRSTLSHVLGAAGALALAGTIAIMIFPLPSARRGSVEDAMEAIYEDPDEDLGDPDEGALVEMTASVARACDLHRAGKEEEAKAVMARMNGEHAAAGHEIYTVDFACQMTDLQREACQQLRAKGPAMFGDPSRKQVQDMARYQEIVCKGLEARP
ncbi:MAG: rhomboid family intramembrane serine protease [Polyangiaceae bacterium]